MSAQRTIKWDVLRWMGLAALLVVCGVLLARPGGVTLAQAGAWIGVVPDNLQITVDGDGVNEVKVGDVNDLYGVEFHLTFDPACVQVKGDADPSTPGIQIQVGSLLSGPNAFVARNEANNANGTIDFVATLRRPANPVTGGGAVARITWTAKCKSDLILSNTKLGDFNGQAIPHIAKNGKISISPQPLPKVFGIVLLQGRSHYADTDVFMSEICDQSVFSAQAIIPGLPTAKTAENGYFEIVPYPGHTYKCLSVFRHGYLAARKSLPIMNPKGDAGVITLPAGDMNEDDHINIFDLVLIASHYGEHSPIGDVNGDGVVDVYDLSLAAGNFGKEGPLHWK